MDIQTISSILPKEQRRITEGAGDKDAVDRSPKIGLPAFLDSINGSRNIAGSSISHQRRERCFKPSRIIFMRFNLLNSVCMLFVSMFRIVYKCFTFSLTALSSYICR